MHINNYEPETYEWLIQKFDFPNLPFEWKIVREGEFERNFTKAKASGSKDPRTAAYNMTKGSPVVFGKYASKMRMKQHKEDTWADSERLNAEHDAAANNAENNMSAEMAAKVESMKIAFQNGEISEAEYMTYADMEKMDDEAPPSMEEEFLARGGPDNSILGTGEQDSAELYGLTLNANPFCDVDLPDIGSQLTEEDKVYLALKWGRMHTAEEWIELERTWLEYENSFDLHNADLVRGTIQLCKLDVEGNAALDAKDYDAYAKISRASDALRKSLKFTEAQRKEDKQADFNCYGQIVRYAELNNDEDYISPLDLSIDRDIVDKDIRDIKNFTANLVKEDPAVWKMIENYIKKRENLQIAENVDEETEATDEDLHEYTVNVDEQIQSDMDSVNDEGEVTNWEFQL